MGSPGTQSDMCKNCYTILQLNPRARPILSHTESLCGAEYEYPGLADPLVPLGPLHWNNSMKMVKTDLLRKISVVFMLFYWWRVFGPLRLTVQYTLNILAD